jgi:hypothetical protein
VSEESDALLHIADDHPCCKLTLLWAHNRLIELERENAALRDDKARLDWLLTHEGGAWVYWQDHGGSWHCGASATRAAIDAARKEAQP